MVKVIHTLREIIKDEESKDQDLDSRLYCTELRKAIVVLNQDIQILNKICEVLHKDLSSKGIVRCPNCDKIILGVV